MKTYADKPQQTESKSVSAAAPLKLSGGDATFQFSDNRLEASEQRKQQKMANNSPQVSQLKALQQKVNDNSETSQLHAVTDDHSMQINQSIQKKENKTGLPDNLKSGMENLSGISLDDVKVHRNSDKPAQLHAHAYAEGTNIHLGPGQEKHLAHEAWHVVQQKQGRVKPTLQMKETININDDQALEKEADVMGDKSMQMASISGSTDNLNDINNSAALVQLKTGMEVELHVPFYKQSPHSIALSEHFIKSKVKTTGLSSPEGKSIVDFMYGGLDYGVSYGKEAGFYDISADHIGFRRTHKAIVAHLLDNGYMKYPGGDFKSMTNIEYRSKEQEERTPEGQTKTEQTSEKIQSHASSTAEKATSGNMTALSAPVSGFYTGIPEAQLKKLMVGDNAGIALVDKLKNEINPRIYFQTTTGVLPSEIPDLFQEAAADLKAKDPASLKAAMLENAIAQTKSAVDEHRTATLLSSVSKGDIKSLEGWMTLVAQYMMAWQLETSSMYYGVHQQTGQIRKLGGSTAKNMVAYLSKTHLVDSINALPDSVRPNISNGENRNHWHNLFKSFYQKTISDFDLITKLGLTDYNGQFEYNSKGKKVKKIKHDEIFSTDTPDEFLVNLLEKNTDSEGDYEAFHVITGNELTLDDGQESPTLNPKLTIGGEQAIPLEDRNIHAKESTIGRTEINKVQDQYMAEWSKAKNRRIGSTQERTSIEANYNLCRDFYNSFGNALIHIPSLNALKLEFNTLNRNAADVEKERTKIDAHKLKIDNWKTTNTNDSVALALVSPLLRKTNWSTKGKALMGTKVPSGISTMRKTLNGSRNANGKLAQMASTATTRLRKGTRDNATTNAYELMRDTPNWLTQGAAGWNAFIAKWQTTDGLV